jgi:hypothetical protein
VPDPTPINIVELSVILDEGPYLQETRYFVEPTMMEEVQRLLERGISEGFAKCTMHREGEECEEDD